MNQITGCDWLPERARSSHLARSGTPAVSRKKYFPESHIINPLLTKSFDKYRPEQKKKSFLLTANKTPVGKLMKISDVTGN